MKKAVKTSLAIALGMTLLTSSVVPAMADTTNNQPLNLGLSSYKAGEQTAIEFLFDTSKVGSSYGLNEIQLIMPLFDIPKTISVNDISINGVKPKNVETSNGTIKIELNDELKTSAFSNNLLVTIRKEAGVENPNRSGTQQVTAFLKYKSGNTLTVFSGEANIQRWTPSEFPQGASMSPAPDKTSTVKPTEGFEVDLSSYKAGEETSLEFEFNTSDKLDDSFGAPISSIQLFLPLFNLPTSINKSDILVNGVEPESIKVSKSSIELTMPKNNTALMTSKVLVLVRSKAEVRNPNEANSYSVNAYVRFSDSSDAKTLKQNVAIEPWSPADYPNDLVYEPEPTPTPTPTPEPTPTPTPEPPKEVEVKKDLTVVVQVGSNIGGYKSVVAGSETDKLLTFDAAPFIKDGSTLVPLRFVSEGLGAKVDYDNFTQMVTLDFGNKTIKLKSGFKTAVIDGKSVDLPVAPEIVNGSMVVPLRFVSENFGAKVEWSQSTQIVTVTKTTTEKVVVKS